MNKQEKLIEATMLALQGKLLKEDNKEKIKYYAIVDNEGNVYAHDIQGETAANLTLADTINSLKETLTNKEIEDLEIEIIEQDNISESKKIIKHKKVENNEFYTNDASNIYEYVQEELTNEERFAIYENMVGEKTNDIDVFWDWFESLDSDDIDELVREFPMLFKNLNENYKKVKKEDKTIKNLRNEQGVCPKCGSTNLEYEPAKNEGDMLCYPWKCNNCGADGEEWYELTFAGHNLQNEDGDYIELQEASKSNSNKKDEIKKN